MKTTYITWSGGYDSTSLIFYYLDNEPETNLALIPFTMSGIHPDARKQEEEARKELFKMFKEKFPNRNVVVGYPSNVDFCKGSDFSKGLAHQQTWLYLASMLPFKIEKYEEVEVAMGYVKGDDFWHIKHEALTVWDLLLKIRFPIETPERNIKLVFPFEWCSKEKLLECWETDNRHDYFKYLSTSEYGKPWTDNRDDGDPKNIIQRELYDKLINRVGLINNPPEQKAKDEVKESVNQ